MDKEPEYITVAEASKIMGICADNVRKLARQPSFPCVIVGRRYIINKEGLYEWMSDHEGMTVYLE